MTTETDLWVCAPGANSEQWRFCGWGDAAELDALEAQLIQKGLQFRSRRMKEGELPTNRGPAGTILLDDIQRERAGVLTNLDWIHLCLRAQRAGKAVPLTQPEPPARAAPSERARRPSLLFPEPEAVPVVGRGVQIRPNHRS